MGRFRARCVDWAPWFSGLHTAVWERRAWTFADEPERLERARAFIDRAYGEAIDLEAVARRACYSPFHFLRLFRRRFGMTPHEYLTRRRVGRARELLERSDASVTQICLDVGFESLGSFVTLFHRHVGHPPGRYRKRIVAVPALPPAIPWCFFSAYRRSG